MTKWVRKALEEIFTDLVKLDNYLIKNFGFKMASKIKTDAKKKKDLYRTVLLRELSRNFKYADAVMTRNSH
jgi:hypothetical protein